MISKEKAVRVLLQLKEIAVLQLKRDRLGMQVVIILGLAFLPVLFLGVRMVVLLVSPSFIFGDIPDLGAGAQTITGELKVLGTLFQSYYFFAFIFISLTYGGHLFKDEFTNRTMHHLFLSYTERWLILGGKFATFVVVGTALCWLSVFLSYFLTIIPLGASAVIDFIIHGPGIIFLIRFLIITSLALWAYGAIATFLGIAFKNPTIPGFSLLVWEMINAYLPGSLKPFSVAYYLQSLLPISIPKAKLFEILAKPTSSWLAFFVPIVIGLGALWTAYLFLKRKEIAYT